MDQEVLYINPQIIEQIQETPDTVLSLTNGKKLVLLNSAKEVTSMILDYWKMIYAPKDKEEYLAKMTFIKN
jgi:flagellar protein FlbD